MHRDEVVLAHGGPRGDAGGGRRVELGMGGGVEDRRPRPQAPATTRPMVREPQRALELDEREVAPVREDGDPVDRDGRTARGAAGPGEARPESARVHGSSVYLSNACAAFQAGAIGRPGRSGILPWGIMRPWVRPPPRVGDARRRPRADSFRHSYSKDKAQLVRRLSRIEGQVRGIARMIEREEYCVDILQQTAALRAAVDAVSIMVLEDHVQGCVRTAAERGEADKYVDEVLDVVRRTLGRPVRGAPGRLTAPRAGTGPLSTANRGGARVIVDKPPLTPLAAPFYRPHSAQRARASGSVVPQGPRGDPGRNRRDGARPTGRRRVGERSTPGAAPGRPSAHHRRVPWTAREFRSRRAFRTSRRSPTRTRRVLDDGIRGPGHRRFPADARAVIDAPRPAAARLDGRDQPDRDPRPGRRSRASTSSTAWPRCRTSSGAAIGRVLDLGSGGGFPGPAARGGAAARTGRCSWTRSARRSGSCGP